MCRLDDPPRHATLGSVRPSQTDSPAPEPAAFRGAWAGIAALGIKIQPPQHLPGGPQIAIWILEPYYLQIPALADTQGWETVDLSAQIWRTDLGPRRPHPVLGRQLKRVSHLKEPRS